MQCTCSTAATQCNARAPLLPLNAMHVLHCCPLQGISLEVFGMMDEGTGQIASMKTLFEEKEPELEKVYDEAKAANEDGTVSDADFAEAQKTWDDFNSDKATIFEQIAVVEGQVTALLEVIRGTADSDEDAAAAGESGEAGDSAARHRQRRAVSDAEPDAQGMEKGLFSVVQCYQVNARYQAVVNLLCSQFFDTIVRTCLLIRTTSSAYS